MKRIIFSTLAVLLLRTVLHANNNLSVLSSHDANLLSIDVWVNKGEASIYHTGENIQIYFRANEDCFATIYTIDADGRTAFLFPHYPDDGFIHGGETYRLPDYYNESALIVNGHRGVEYIQALATREPHAIQHRYDRSGYFIEPSHISGDPFEAINLINTRLLPSNDLHATATTSFFIESFVWYPRYMCSSCHTAARVQFDPYDDICPRYQIITVHHFDYWWGADYYPIRVNFRFGSPFWKWELRGIRPNRYRHGYGHLRNYYGFGNYFTPIPPRTVYVPLQTREVRYRHYERDYRTYPPRYDARSSGSTRYRDRASRVNQRNPSDSRSPENVSGEHRASNENGRAGIRSNDTRSIEPSLNNNPTRDRTPEQTWNKNSPRERSRTPSSSVSSDDRSNVDRQDEWKNKSGRRSGIDPVQGRTRSELFFPRPSADQSGRGSREQVFERSHDDRQQTNNYSRSSRGR